MRLSLGPLTLPWDHETPWGYRLTMDTQKARLSLSYFTQDA